MTNYRDRDPLEDNGFNNTSSSACANCGYRQAEIDNRHCREYCLLDSDRYRGHATLVASGGRKVPDNCPQRYETPASFRHKGPESGSDNKNTANKGKKSPPNVHFI